MRLRFEERPAVAHAPAFHPLHPLDRFYTEAGRPVPKAREIDPDHMPQPYRRLLVHDDDMTPTLEAAYGDDVGLRVLRRRLSDDVVFREVILFAENSGAPVEMGAIEIRLAPFPEQARARIIAGRKPLGAILREAALPHYSRPEAFFEVFPDETIRRALDAGESAPLYARRNVLRALDGAVLARVLEILPPTDPFAR